MHVPQASPRRTASAVSRYYERLLSIRRSFELYVMRNKDAVRRELFRTAVRWHAHDIDDVWRKEERRVNRLLGRALGDYYKEDPTRAWQRPAFNWRPVLFDYPPVLRNFAIRVLLGVRELGRGLIRQRRASAR
jgi:hypothetical protein